MKTTINKGDVGLLRIVVAYCGVLILAMLSMGPVIGPAMADQMVAALRPQASMLLCGETVPMHDSQVVERFEKEMLLSLDNRAQLILWLKRSTRYFPFIEKTLAQHRLPDDLKYLAVAESALRVHVGSTKGAMGMWQLMPQTARKYGLQVDDAIDERRNPYLSMSSAVAYLKALYDRFGSWTLSLAAYNMGEERLEAEMLEQGVNDYYRLYLPLETQRFIFRILAIKMIFQAPETHGVNLNDLDYYAPLVFTTVQLQKVKDLPLRLIAAAARTDFKTIKDLNPELRGYYLTTDRRTINLPAAADVGFSERLATLMTNAAALGSRRLYVVKKGDSLSGIAEKFNVPVAALLIWNQIGIQHVIHPDQRLVVFPPLDTHAADPITSDKEELNKND